MEKFFETDISSCDMSNRDAVFDACRYLFKDHPCIYEVMDRNAKQCKLPLHVFVPGTKKKIKIKFKPAWHIEFSGSTLTTLLNNIANVSIGHSVWWSCVVKNRPATPLNMQRAAAEAGYKITVEERDTPESFTLLKHFPWFNGTRWVSSFSVAPFLRGFGTCDYDLPTRSVTGKKLNTIDARVNAWNSTVVAGYIHSGLQIFTQELKKLYNSFDRVRLPGDLSKHFNLGKRESTPIECYARRYSVSVGLIQDFIDTLKEAKPLCVIHHEFINRVNQMDYGLAAQSFCA